MEVNQIIVFNDKLYVVKKIFYRTVGSFNQKLSTTICSQTEHRRTFGLVENNEQLFWVKEYTVPDYGYCIGYEFSETKRLHQQTNIGDHEIRTVRMIDLDKNRLLMEYCDGYAKLTESSLTPHKKALVVKLVQKWIEEHSDVHDYDMCGNNILIKTDNNISVRLIDFEYSVDVNIDRWKKFLKGL